VGWFIGAMMAVIALVAAVIFDATSRGEERIKEVDIPPEHREALIALDREAVEQAYRQQAMHLFLTWMKDETGQPERLMRGIQQARRGYVESMKAIDERASKR